MSNLTINSNIASLQTQRRLAQNSTALNSVYQRLSSGQRINHASDDAAGLAIASDLENSARVYTQGLRNINDGISLLSVSEGALQELSNITLRQRELAAQAANATNSSAQRNSLHLEAVSLSQEYNRIIAATKFNDVATLDGTLTQFNLQGGFGVDGGIGISVNSGLLHGDYDGTVFANSTAISAPSGNGNFAVGDVNGDGRDDFALSGSGTMTVTSGDGSVLQSLTGAGGSMIKLADVNSDSFLDVVTMATSGAIMVSFGNGNGSFKAFATIGAGLSNTVDFAIGDFNGDGKKDLVETSTSGADSYINIRLGNGNGTFKGPATNTVINTTASISIAMADLNSDGRDDILITTVANGPLIGMGNSGTTIITFNSSPVPATGTILAVTDVTGDGKVDAVVGNTNYFKVLTGTGAGSFSAGASIAITGTAQTAGDFNGDGFLDILSSSTTGGYIRMGNGNGTFKATGLSFNIAVATVGYAAAGDFDADGHLDIAALRSTQPSGQINYQTPSGSLTTEAELVNLSTVTQARIAMDNLDLQLGRIDQEIGVVGAALSRLSSAAENLTTLRENYQVAASNIKDADVATDAAELVRLNILQQGSAAILAQANSSPQMLLKLLEGET